MPAAALVAAAAISTAAAGTALAGPADGPAPIGGAQLGPGLAANLAPGIKALPRSTLAKAWLVADLDTGNVLAAFNPHVPHPPASTLKTLAALALIPRVGPAAQVPFTADELALTAQKDGVSTRVGLQVGHSYPAKRLLEAMLALSANDAAEALSAAAPGGRAAVLDAMNGIATSLQARDSHAETPDGLPAPGQLESAYDEALIVRAALQLKDFSAYDTTKRVSIPGKPPFGGSNHDRLQNSYPGVIGGKDGYTVASGQVWWGAAKKKGHRLVVVVMDAGFAPVTQEIDLLNWGFAVDGKITPAGTLVGPVTSTGQPTTVKDVADGKAPGSVAAPPAPRVTAKRNGNSGAWRWVLGGLIALAAIVLGRRHLRAAGPARTADPIQLTPVASEPPEPPAPPAETAAPENPPQLTTADSSPVGMDPVAAPPLGFAPILGTTALPDHRVAAILTTIPLNPAPPAHVHVRPLVAEDAGAPAVTAAPLTAADDTSAHQTAAHQTPAPVAASPLQQPLVRRLSASELRSEDVRPSGIDELEVVGPAAAPAALEAQHQRLRTGSVKIVPRP